MKIKRLVYSKYAPILAFIPVVNLVYLVLRFLCGATGREAKNYIATIFTLIVAAILYYLLPGAWGWAVTYALVSVMSFGCLLNIRKNGSFDKKTMTKRAAVLVPLVIILALVLIWVFNSGSAVKVETRAMLNALCENDSQQWDELLFSSHIDTMNSLESFSNALKSQQGIELNGAVERLTQTGISVRIQGGVHQTSATYRAIIGGIKYTVKVTYQESKSAKGFSSISIERP